MKRLKSFLNKIFGLKFYRHKFRAGVHDYYECEISGHRTFKQWSLGYSALDNSWLNGGIEQ